MTTHTSMHFTPKRNTLEMPRVSGFFWSRGAVGGLFRGVHRGLQPRIFRFQSLRFSPQFLSTVASLYRKNQRHGGTSLNQALHCRLPHFQRRSGAVFVSSCLLDEYWYWYFSSRLHFNCFASVLAPPGLLYNAHRGAPQN